MITHLSQSKAPTEPTDGQLVERFVVSRDETAFALLVDRHAAMVWSVCFRVLRDYHDAEDAFQATFVVLSRKATSVVPREMVASWLFGVARTTALKVRGSRQRIRARETVAGDLSQHPARESDRWEEFYSLFYEELYRLPGRYRAVVVLCDLEGKTRKVAARELGVPYGSVAGWLDRARKLLARRLARHGGISLSIAMGTLFSRELLAGCEPQVPLNVVAQNQSSLALGAITSSNVSQLAERVITIMFWEKVKTAASTIVLATAVLACGVAVIQTLQAEVTPANQAVQESDAESAKQAAKIGDQVAIPATVTDVLPSVATVRTKKTEQGREINGLGMATAIDERGILLTTSHVVAGVSSITVEFPNRKPFEARLLAVDGKHDLALLQVAERMPVTKFGDSSTVRVGDAVRTVRRTGPSATGHVTALGRTIEVNEKRFYENLLENDAALSPGDSGGPLLDEQGRMIGVNVAIRAGRQRIGFALPINDVLPVIAELLKSTDTEKAPTRR